MSIDSGQSITFNANYPVPNVDQSSQQFRDNFLITKTAIENLQSASNTTASIFTLQTSMSGQAVQFDIQYKNGALVLPTGTPATPATGMIRYNSGSIEFYSAGAWHPVVYQTGGVVTIPSLVVTTLATVPVAVNPTDATQYSQLQTETAARIAGDAALAASIANVAANAVTSTDLDAVADAVGQFGGDIANNAAAIAQETADRIANDALIAANVVTLQSNVDGAYATANAAFAAANAAAGAAQPAFDQANAALSLASNAVAKSGDSMTGPLIITAGGNAITVNGNAHITGTLTVDTSIYSAGDITAFSDMALKYDIVTIPDALAKVNALRGTMFTRADLEGNPRQMGFIAQELQDIIPEVVHEHPTNGLLSVAYGNLVAVLVEAVKELSKEVAELKAR